MSFPGTKQPERRAGLRFAALCVAVLTACGTEEPPLPEPIEFAEVCGTSEPVRLLHFEPWREVLGASNVGVWGSHRVLRVYYTDSYASAVLWAIGPCGEAQRKIPSDGYGGFDLSRYDTPLWCDSDTSEIRAFDLSGERAPSPVFKLSQTRPCYARPTDAGLYHVRPGSEGSTTGTLMVHAWPDDVWAGLVEPSIAFEGVNTGLGLELLGDQQQLFFTNAANELVRLTVEDGAFETIAAGVYEFRLGFAPTDGGTGQVARYLLWQGIEPTNQDPEQPEGELVLYDLETAEQTALGEGALGATPMQPLAWSASGVLVLPHHGDGQPSIRIYELPTLSYIEVPATLELRYLLANEGYFVARDGEDGPLVLLDRDTGDVQPLFGKSAFAWWGELRSLALLPELSEDDYHRESPLWLLDGYGEPELIANRATKRHDFMPDGRLLTTINLDRHGIGDLIVVDPATLEERLIATGVNAPRVEALGDASDDTTLIYSVLEGERRGVWLVRLPPRE